MSDEPHCEDEVARDDALEALHLLRAMARTLTILFGEKFSSVFLEEIEREAQDGEENHRPDVAQVLDFSEIFNELDLDVIAARPALQWRQKYGPPDAP